MFNTHPLLYLIASTLILPLHAMERPEKTPHQESGILQEVKEARDALSKITRISSTDSGSNVADPNSMAYKRQSLGQTKQEIWSKTILVAGLLVEQAHEKLQTLDPHADQKNAWAVAEDEYIKAANLYIHGYLNGYQKEALKYICESIDPILEIEQKKSAADSNNCPHKNLPILSNKLKILITQEIERSRLKKMNRGSRTYSIPLVEAAMITSLNNQTQRINNKIRFTNALIEWAKEYNSAPSYENCVQCKKLCYSAVLSFFNIFELNKNEEVLNWIDETIKIVANSDRWIYNNARDRWEVDEKLNKVAVLVAQIRKDLNHMKERQEIAEIVKSNDYSPRKTTVTAQELDWKEFLYASMDTTNKTDGKESPTKRDNQSPERGRPRSGSGGPFIKTLKEALSKIFKKK